MSTFTDYVNRVRDEYLASGGIDAGRVRWDAYCRSLGTTPEEYERQTASTPEEIRRRVYQGQAARELPARPLAVAMESRAGGSTSKPWEWLRARATQVAHRDGSRWVGQLALLCGPPGVGKTVAACRLALAMADRCASVRYTSRWAEDWLRSDSPRRRQLAKADLLIVDESARALEQGAWVQGAAKELLNERYDSGGPTLVIFTGPFAMFAERFGMEITDRVPPDLRYSAVMTEDSLRWTP